MEISKSLNLRRYNNTLFNTRQFLFFIFKSNIQKRHFIVFMLLIKKKTYFILIEISLQITGYFKNVELATDREF